MRVRKLDVGWVAPGYRFALTACDDAHQGIEAASDARGFVWLPEGWAGTQRCGVHWSGDQSGSWDYLRWQIPTYAGSTMSGQAYTAGDLDGIFNGSAHTYLRDLQWKTFLPVAMAMNGWSPREKTPWRDGEPYTSINRSWIQLRERLLPYFYTYAARAHRNGVGLVRPLVLEYQDDPTTWGEAVQHEFLSGEAFLVAPVFEDSTVRDNVYLPAGTWFDYWTGARHVGPVTLDGVAAPPERMPVFVKAGSIVPMWPEGTRSWQTVDRSQLDLDVYPGSGSFTLYEDDGVTRASEQGAFAEQTFTVTDEPAHLTVGLGATRGSYAGKATARRYLLSVHDGARTTSISMGGTLIPRVVDRAALDAVASGWYPDPSRGGITVVKTVPVGATEPAELLFTRF